MNPSGQMAGIAGMAGRMQHPQQPNMRSNSHEQLVRQIAPWMQSRGLPFNPHPTAAGRPVNLVQLFQVVMRLGGSKAVTARSQWPAVAQHLQVPPAQIMMVADEIYHYWQSNMLHYEHQYIQSQQQRQRAMQEQARMQRPPPNGEISSAQDPYSPLKQMNAHLQENQPHAATTQIPNQNGYLTPSKRVDHQQPDPRAPPPNGYLTPHHGSMDARHSAAPTRQGPPLPNQAYRSPSQPMIAIDKPRIAKSTKEKVQGDTWPRIPLGGLPEEYSPKCDSNYENKSTLERHGGLVIDAVRIVGDQVASSRPDMPQFHELGVVDIRALTLSLKSGIKGEVRLALDNLCVLSYQMDLDLANCGDLVDALIECAEEQVDLLAENAVEVSDAILINSYEDNIRGAKAENESFQVPPEYGSLEYDLERAVDRLICITTILRNLSSFEPNCLRLATPTVITVMANVMRYLGTRNMLLRTHKNTVDFTKDMVIYLSNASRHIDLPGKEEALWVLHFLLSFAPRPPPTNGGNDDVIFPAYDPLLHGYLPHAIDSFAKLLAKDEPNRGFFRSIFLADGSSLPPFELLTKAFGFAISVLPKYEPPKHEPPKNEPPKEELPTHELSWRRQEQHKIIIQARGAYVAQGLLAAEIVVGLIPASEHSLSRAWLASQDGFAANLIRMVLCLGEIPRQSPDPRFPPQAQFNEADELYVMVASRGIAVLRKLAERAKDADADGMGLPPGVLPGKLKLLEILKNKDVDAGWLRSVHAYATLEI